jgi:hypothetical protein
MRKNSVLPGLGGGDGLKMVARQLARGPRQQNEGLNALFDYGFIAGVVRQPTWQVPPRCVCLSLWGQQTRQCTVTWRGFTRQISQVGTGRLVTV